jgi:hypothetical protein
MNSPLRTESHEELLAYLTDIAYRAVLRQGLTRSFVDVELELWRDIRNEYGSRGDTAHVGNRSASLSLVS